MDASEAHKISAEHKIKPAQSEIIELSIQLHAYKGRYSFEYVGKIAPSLQESLKLKGFYIDENNYNSPTITTISW